MTVRTSGALGSTFELEQGLNMQANAADEAISIGSTSIEQAVEAEIESIAHADKDDDESVPALVGGQAYNPVAALFVGFIEALHLPPVLHALVLRFLFGMFGTSNSNASAEHQPVYIPRPTSILHADETSMMIDRGVSPPITRPPRIVVDGHSSRLDGDFVSYVALSNTEGSSVTWMHDGE